PSSSIVSFTLGRPQRRGDRGSLYTVTDNNGCTNNAEFAVSQRVNPIPVITGDSLLCPNEVTQLQTADNFISYNWSTGSTTNTTTFDVFGTVTVSVLDSFSCPGSATYDIDTLVAPVPTISGDTEYCQGDSTQIFGEAGFVSYLWSTGDTVTSINTDMPGTLTLTVTDNNGCIGENNIVVSERPTPMPTITGDVIFCANESGFIEAPGGFITYTWSNGLTFQEIEIFDPGTYSVTVVDDLGCQGEGTIVADTASIPAADIFGDTYVCETGDGTLFTNPVGNYLWSNGDTTSVITIQDPGIYTVTITDQNGCSNIALASVDLQPDPNPVILGDPILCPGETTELSTALSYTSYSWSTGSLDSTITTGFVPQVAVDVIDEFGCMGAATIDLNAVPNPNVAIDGQLAVCDGEGTILQATEGFITYLWSTGSDSSSALVSQNGLYTVTVTDANGCQNSANSTLIVNPNPKPDIQGNANLCRGETATLTVRDNFLSYNWSNGGTDRFIQVSESGDYVVEVNSPGGCINRDTFTVTVFEPRITPINNAVLDICDGDTLTLDAGPGFQSYQWSTGALSQSISINMGGSFNVMVVDSNGCRTNGNIIVNAQALPQPGIIAPGIFCRGTPVSLLADGNYRIYEWSNGDFGDIIEIDEGGNYDLTVTDNNGCRGTTSVFLDERNSPDVDIAGDLLICRGDTTTLTIPNEFRYVIWTDDTNDTSLVVTEPGNYGVLVLSDNGCAGADEVQVLFRDDPLPVITGDLNNCSNETGTLDAGPGFEQYIWDTGDTTQTITYDTARIYEVRVFDDFGCDNIARVQVTAVQAPIINFDRPPGICPGESVEVSIDSSFTSIVWSNGLTTPTVRLDSAGMYQVTVSDSTNCVTTDSFNLVGFLTPIFNLNGDSVVCEGTTARIDIDRIFPSITWSDGSNGTFIEVDSTSTYRVTVANDEGCESSQDWFVLVNPAPPVLPGPDTLLNCFNPVVQLGLGANLYPANVQLTWTGPGIADSSRNDFQPSINQPGDYSLIAVDTLTNCPSTLEQVNVIDLQYTPGVQVQSDEIVDCITGTTMIDGIGTQIGDEFIYRWTVGENDSLLTTNTLQIEVNEAALYKLEIIDTITGCTNFDTLNLVIDPELPAALIFPVDILSCDRPTQTLTAAPPPPGSMWGYRWIRPMPLNDTIRTDSLIVNQAGLYRLIVDNSGNGCVDTTSIEVTRNDTPPDISAGPDAELDCNFPEVQIGEPFAEDRWIVTWSKAGEIDFFTAMKNPIISEAGEYRLEVLDPFNGCISFDTVNITAYEESPNAIAILVEDEQCFGDENGSLQILGASGGEGPYLYSFNEESFSSNTSFLSLPSGRFTLRVQDLRGCEYDTTIIVNQGLDPLLDLGPDRFITQGEFVRLTALTNIQPGGLASLQWTQPDTVSCDTCAVLRVSPIKTTEFSSVVVDTNGCIASDSVMIFVDRTKSVYIPNAFSPNGDGFNDRVTVFASPNVRQVLTFRIFQRSGDLMFQRDEFSPNDLSLGWNGFHKGKLMNSQTFVYYAQVEFDDGEIVEFEGGIHLVR
ncbi:MAG: T9SS type B sorting domain-containing protein, partial [Bacteroidota bacterium]